MPLEEPSKDAGNAPVFTAQFGEDRILAEIFHGKTDGYYVEVGAYDGVTSSNTFYFEQIGWNGLIIEPDHEMAEACRANRPRATVAECAVVGPYCPPTISFSIVPQNQGLSAIAFDAHHENIVRQHTGAFDLRMVTVQACTLDQLLEDAGAPPGMEFVTIDVEGHEWSVFEGFDLSRWHPRFIIIERNTRLPDRRILSHLSSQKYCYRRTTGVNDWFESTPKRSLRSCARLNRRFHWRCALKPKFTRQPLKIRVLQALRKLKLDRAALALWARIKR